MVNGTILESGALNGETFSNSLMFEKFSSWFTIHVGKIILYSYAY